MFGGVHLIGAILLTFVLVAYLALFPAIAGYIGRLFFAKFNHIFLLVIIPVLWILTEWCRAWIFTGFPWLQLGYSQIDSPLKGIAPLFGIYGVSWAVAFSSSLLVVFCHNNLRIKILSFITLLLLWSSSWMLNSKNWTKTISNDISIALIQGGIPQELKWKRELRQSSFDLYQRLSTPHWGSDLVVWPETAIPAFYHHATDFIDELKVIATSNNTNLLVGIPFSTPQTNNFYNSVVVLNDDTPMYHKRHLVPFGEYLPLEPLLRPILNYLHIPISNFTAGTQETPVISVAGIDIGISICYEDTFGNEVIQALPDAHILVNVSNDAWFGDSIAPHQHLQMARMRALETGRYMLRATNTGISAIINEKGDVLKKSIQFNPDVLTAEVPLFSGITPYARFGDMPVIIMALLLLFGIYKKRLTTEQTKNTAIKKNRKAYENFNK